jgi:hypothetical protein
VPRAQLGRINVFYHGASGGAGNNLAKGHYTESAKMVDQVLGAVRLETSLV